MLILPLHQPITRANFPLATAALVLINVFVFLVLQGRDHAAMAAASQYYADSLAKIEAPLYQRHLAEHKDSKIAASLAEVPAEIQPLLMQQWSQHDPEFRARLRSGELFADEQARAAWQPLDTRYQTLRQRVFTDRFDLDADAPSALTALSSMFLHGSFDHLLGNMVFLIALGLLVEGPLGSARFLGLYTLGGVGAGLAWVASNDWGSVVGASGAIAALMGAFCVLWGRRRVRFFYWFFVVFDYIKGPALALLPAWLGWELLQWWLSDGSRVAYEAHAGGIVSGALLGLFAVRMGWRREEFLVESGPTLAVSDPLPAALEQLGQLQLAEAERLLVTAEQFQPGRFDVALARFRSARLSNQMDQAQARLDRLLDFASPQRDQVRAQQAATQEALTAGMRVSATQRLELAQRLLAIGDAEAADAALRPLLEQDALSLDLAQPLLSLAFRLQERAAVVAARRVLERLIAIFPDSAQADKARFLLAEWGV